MAYCVHTICIENGFKLHFSTTYASSNIKIEAWKHVWVVSLFAKFQRTSLLNHFHPHDDLCNLCGKLGNRSDIRQTASFHRNCKPLPLFYIQIKPQRFRVCKVNLGRTFRIPGSGSMSLLVHDL